jgi:hypothetical protein
VPAIKWILSTRTPNPVTVLDTGLNALAQAAGVTSGDIANSSDLDMFADLELVCTHGTAPVVDRTWDVYMVRRVDGTNYENGSATRPPANGYLGSFKLDAVTSAQRMVVPGVVLPPGTFRILLVNSSGQAAAATGNTLKLLVYNQVV